MVDGWHQGEVAEAGLARVGDKIDGLVRILELVRSGSARTRTEVGVRSGLGRTVVSQRLAELIDFGLVRESGLGPSTGGRAPRHLEFCADGGCILVAELGATSISVGVSDLSGVILDSAEVAADIAEGPEPVLGRTELLLDALCDKLGVQPDRVWGVGIGIPCPVEYASGRPVSPPLMPGWDGYDIRARFSSRYCAPVWVDNEVNLMALGELRSGLGRGHADLIYLKIGTGIGAGIIAGGRLHRGAQGCAGDVGHVAAIAERSVVCRCGNLNCLEALAGGAAIARDAQEGVAASQTELLRPGAGVALVTAREVATAALRGDTFCLGLLTDAGALIGQTLAQLVNFYNPSLVVIGGGIAQAGDFFLAAIRQATYARSTPLATRDLRIEHSPVSKQAGLVGAAVAVADELLSSAHIPLWIEHRSPHGLVCLSQATASPIESAS
ncbi:MAG: ROK family protein [Actinomycetota bacterium]|nr:ROK family protein [Actinomycetota bacterium]